MKRYHWQTNRNLALTMMLCVLSVMCEPAAGERQFSVASYNLEHFMDVFDDPYSKDESADVKSHREIERIAEALQRLDADLVALQEVEKTGALKALVQEHLPGQGYEYALVNPTNADRGIHLGVISRWPILSVTSHRFREFSIPQVKRTWRFARDLLEVVVRVSPQQRLHVFVVHFKSKRDSPEDPNSADWRFAEARCARRIMARRRSEQPNAWMMLVGDLNDTPRSRPLRTLLRPARANNGLQLTDAHAHRPASQRVTYLRKPYRSTIDYVLIGRHLAERLVPRETRVLQDESLLGGSDHAPLIAQFRFE